VTDTTEGQIGFTKLVFSRTGSKLLAILAAEDIEPGSSPSYEMCKLIYTYHPLGAKLAENPIQMAQSQRRTITVPRGPETRLVEAFWKEWDLIGAVGADTLIRTTMVTARIYGIGSLGVGERGQQDTAEPLDLEKVAKADLFFNIFDPLNTAGSLVLDQDPNSPDFQKPKKIRIGSKEWHLSRCVVMMNEQPVYIEFSNSAFGFVGRSVYQRTLFPLKTFLQSMITDDMVTKKIALLIWMAKSATSAISQRILNILGWKRQQLQGGNTGNVVMIGDSEKVESINFQNLEGAGRFTRENVLKNIGAGAGMPAGMIDQETMVKGFGEGSEDAKNIARYIDNVRTEMRRLYAFMDDIVMRRAWTEEFYESLKAEAPELSGIPYATAFQEWRNSFNAVWPNLLTEPDSEKIKTEEVRFKSVVALIEVMAPLLDPENKAALLEWAAEQVSDRKELFSSPLLIDARKVEQYATEQAEAMQQMQNAADKEPKPRPFSAAS
jgi:hypothetical protein